jgi:signal transduction histidine kinase
VPAELSPDRRSDASEPSVSDLRELLSNCKESLLDGWGAALCDMDPSSPFDEDAREHLSSFLAGLDAALLGPDGGGGDPLANPETVSEGIEAPKASIDATAATRAYGFLHGFVLELAAERGVAVGLFEQRTLARHVNGAIARAVSAHLKARKQELHRLAHELRNPLGSAMMALTLLRSRADLGEHTRLAEMLERNLQRLERGLEDAMAREGRGESRLVDRGQNSEGSQIAKKE